MAERDIEGSSSMNLHAWLAIASTTIYWALYPVLLILTWLFYILHWIASPFLWIAYIFKEVAMLPIRFLAQFEVHGPSTSTMQTDPPELD
jgi:hypothetical protein